MFFSFARAAGIVHITFIAMKTLTRLQTETLLGLAHVSSKQADYCLGTLIELRILGLLEFSISQPGIVVLTSSGADLARAK